MRLRAAEIPPTDSTAILVVHRDAVLRTLLAGYLRGSGYLVVEAGDTEDVFSILRTDIEVDMLLADPEALRAWDGFSLADEILKSRPEIQLMMISGVDSAAESICSLCSQGIYTKAHEPADVIQNIRQLQQHRRTTIARS